MHSQLLPKGSEDEGVVGKCRRSLDYILKRKDSKTLAYALIIRL